MGADDRPGAVGRQPGRHRGDGRDALRDLARHRARQPAAWLLPASYAAVAGGGLCRAAFLRSRRPDIYATSGLRAAAITGQFAAPATGAYS